MASSMYGLKPVPFNAMGGRFSAGTVVLLSTLALAGCRATPPSPTETKVAYWAKHHVTVGGKKDVNPIKATEENIEEGKGLFASECMVCHGLDGQNTGVPFAATMSPQVPSLASPEVQAYTDGQLNSIIKNGIYPSGMPGFSGDFGDRDMWEMVLYLRHLPKAGSLGVPKVYSGQ
ncbi:c-type cytochrome [Granulicella paludicola]|uniref:c-type cytochrome n=1 Tax=Granulicella paludicola TaxID=474951 RepID=UPI0021DF8829|nr:c-type cytochrome [Granulicella paludicola]